MTGFYNESEEHHFVEKVIIPILTRYCVQHPIKIDYEKLSKAHSTAAINLFQLAWLQGVSEMNIPDIGSINWDDHSLCGRVLEIQDYLYKITDDEYGRSDVIINGEQKKCEVRFFSPKIVIKLLNSLQLINHQDVLKEKEKAIKRAWQNLYASRLENINLTHELRMGLRDYCRNKPVMLNPAGLPRAFWLKYLAYYLAISSRDYPDYGLVNFDDELIINDAISIHKMLRDTLSSMLNIHLKSLPLMRSDHREIATANGVLQVAVVARTPLHTVSDNESVEVTKELALKLLKQLTEFSYLFDFAEDTKEAPQPVADTKDSQDKLSAYLPPSSAGHDTTQHLKLAIELILTENPNHVLMKKAIWRTLLKKENHPRCKIKAIHGSGAHQEIEFQCGHIANYHAAQVHINKAIAWHKSIRNMEKQ